MAWICYSYGVDKECVLSFENYQLESQRRDHGVIIIIIIIIIIIMLGLKSNRL